MNETPDNRATRLQALRAEVKRRLEKAREKRRVEMVKVEPRYDEVWAEGVRWLDSL